MPWPASSKVRLTFTASVLLANTYKMASGVVCPSFILLVPYIYFYCVLPVTEQPTGALLSPLAGMNK